MNIIIIISCYIRYIHEYVYDRMRVTILQYTYSLITIGMKTTIIEMRISIYLFIIIYIYRNNSVAI